MDAQVKMLRRYASALMPWPDLHHAPAIELQPSEASTWMLAGEYDTAVERRLGILDASLCPQNRPDCAKVLEDVASG